MPGLSPCGNPPGFVTHACACVKPFCARYTKLPATLLLADVPIGQGWHGLGVSPYVIFDTPYCDSSQFSARHVLLTVLKYKP
jgi:hypothetical protein